MSTMTSTFKLHQDSCDSLSHELNLFQSPPTKTSIIEGEYVEIQSLIKPGTDSPVEFQIDGTTDHYLDFENSYLHVKCRVLKKDGTVLSAEPKVMPTNLFLYSLFQSFAMTINGKEIEMESNYGMNVYTRSLINMSKEAKRTHLTGSMWFDDGFGVCDTPDITGDFCTSICKKRAKKIADSRVLDLFGKLYSNLSNQEKYLLPNLNISIKLTRSLPAFALQKIEDDDDDYVIDITNATLLVRKVKVHPSIAIAHEKMLDSGKKALYTANRVETQFFTISPNRQSESINILQNKQEAKRIVIGFMNHSAKNGSYAHNSLRFHHYDISSINLLVNGHLVPSKPIKLDFDNNQFTRAYFQLMAVSGKAAFNDGNGISLDEFKEGCCLFAFDNTPDQCHGDGVHLVRYSTTTLEVQFKNPLPHTVSVLVLTESEELYEFDKARIVSRASLG